MTRVIKDGEVSLVYRLGDKTCLVALTKKQSDLLQVLVCGLGELTVVKDTECIIKLKELPFEAEYALKEFRDIQDQYYNEEDKPYPPPIYGTLLQEKALNAINELEKAHHNYGK